MVGVLSDGSFKTEAYSAESKGSTLKLVPITLKPLGITQVRVKMLMSGLCHTELHMINNDWGITNFPVVPGHEGIGVVEAVGERVHLVKVGDFVGIGWIRGSCGACSNCRIGRENICKAGYQGTFLSSNAGIWGKEDNSQHGCFAKHMHIEEKFAFKIPETFHEELETAAPLMCAGLTVWEPLVDYCKPGTKVGVIALGGLGHMTVKLAKAIGAEVTVLSTSAKKKQAAFDIGANHFVVTTDKDEMKKIMGQLDLIIDTCPIANDLESSMAALSIGGSYVRVGIPEAGTSNYSGSYIPLIFTQKKIVGSIVSGSTNTTTMLEIAAAHNIRCEVEVMPFEQINEAVTRLTKGEVEKFRIVLKW
mmetsp:Transcript_13103/g.22492  ORF Transcript_13103/g.22492 Transcript_13103/m.22492 type:complete len:362 (+) Transcript_13103:253-1338(+)|eukprot:CAMPEP_0184700296 /NCGR_PEP_ID=MMETSP0313-20130426/11590_1 /TAXON_ID=2792 /ORGANISM="Porphyridium aerugineum, Strain SAG 1380-2" /LENGTH=361 /DNA_ID=CAMNT_0027159885 /DNA_START=227 /DNA_END=1312 /DNA_ORIENTATION=+